MPPEREICYGLLKQIYQCKSNNTNHNCSSDVVLWTVKYNYKWTVSRKSKDSLKFLFNRPDYVIFFPYVKNVKVSNPN